MKKIIIAAAAVAGLVAGAETRVGIIGCDTSHVIAFTKLMNMDKDPDCAGFRVTAAHKWGSPDIFSSTNRFPKYIAQLEEMGVVMKPTIADLLKDVDAVLLETCDGRPHYAQALEVFKSGKPVFIDKPVAASLADAIRIAEAGKQYNAKWFCSSALRYVKNAQAARNGKLGKIRGADSSSTGTRSTAPSRSSRSWARAAWRCAARATRPRMWPWARGRTVASA